MDWLTIAEITVAIVLANVITETGRYFITRHAEGEPDQATAASGPAW